MKTSNKSHNMDNVVDLFTGKLFSQLHETRFIRLAPELDGLEILYSNETSGDMLYSLQILAWGLRANGEVVALVPWLNDIVPCIEICDPLNGKWEGYFDPGIDEVFYEAPIHKVVELETAAEYYDLHADDPDAILQEIPDTIGTHAVLSDNGFKSLTLTQVISWQLHNDGTIVAMLADEEKVESTPILPGDDCLYPAQSSESFRYFFQHQIANKIKSQDPEAMAAISLLVDEQR
ncbi:hypothetical protein [Marinibactrum halimedae]|uniref:Uncharacterized protein n=1 Tax=Marinibactrum halimedae TaxID=1444977 RepID=A0AA37WMG4_9GAMM|nr:hypothetical protein [Marinibactrum halimedae]MCD9457849.1 hypothetical protein [Marinibactrum halimedae]GLS26330.1 hypothetical protein GCM10007877_20450 [Marinibactrum halimedae]